MNHRYAILAGFLALCAIAATETQGRIPDKPLEFAPTSKPPVFLAGTLVVKLSNNVVNRRDRTNFGIPQLDAALARIGVYQRNALFPLAPWQAYDAMLQHGDDAGFNRAYILKFSASLDPIEAARLVMESGDVEFAEPYYVFSTSHTPNDPRVAQQYYLDIIEAEAAWDIAKGDTSVAIGIIDTGLDWLHEDLGGNVALNRGETGLDAQSRDRRSNNIDDDNNGYIDDYHGWDFVGNPTLQQLQSGQLFADNDPSPRPNSIAGYEGYHGTAVGGCASAVTNNAKGIAGIGYHTRLIGIKCAGDSVGTGSVVAGYEGIRYAADAGARVINCSWGSNGDPRFMQGLQMVVDYARSKGALVVAASGNEGTNNDVTPQFPADIPGVLSVGSTTSSDSAAGFSQYGLGVDVWAPGVNTLSTFPENSYNGSGVSGTSFSAPIVAGVAGLLFAQHPDWTPEQVAIQMRVSGDRVKVASPALGPYFYRRLNAHRAVTINSSFTGGDPSLLMPGLAITSYTINGRALDTIRSLGQSVTLRITFKNYLAPSTNIRIEAASSQTLVIDAPATIASIGTMGEEIVELTARISPTAPIVYSEGELQLVLRISSGAYEDYVGVRIPVAMPGWHRQLDPTANAFALLRGSSISAATWRSAWAVANRATSQTTYTPLFARTNNGRDWTQFTAINGTSQPLYTITSLSDRVAWAGSGPTTGGAVVFRTINSGLSWQQSSVAGITPFINAIHFFDSTNGILIGDPQSGRWGIATSSDAGVTWSAIATPLVAPGTEAGWNNSLSAVGDTLWFGTNNSRIYRSVDRGQSWVYAATPDRHSLGVAFTNGGDGMAIFHEVGSTGGTAIAYSHDGGLSWTKTNLPFVGAYPQGVAMVQGTPRAFVSTQNGVYQTENFGTTWQQMPMALISTEAIDLDVSYDSTRGFVGAFGMNAYAQIMSYKDTLSVSNPPLSIGDNAAYTHDQLMSLGSVQPNPVTTTARLPLQLQITADVRLRLHDARGMEIFTLHAGRIEKGRCSIKFDVSWLPNGIYFYTVEAGTERAGGVLRVVR